MRYKGIDIYRYTDFRAYLRDYYAERKRTTRNFSLRYFARRAGFSSHNVLRQVMEGSRNIAYESIGKFIRGLRLEGKRAEYFRAMVLFAQEKEPDEKARLFGDLLGLQKKGVPGNFLLTSQLKLYSDWYHVAIRELITLAGFSENEEAIARRLIPRITPGQVRASLKLLQQGKLISRDSRGTLRQSADVIRTEPEIRSMFARKHLREMGELAVEALDRISPDEREISALTLGISKKRFGLIKKRIQEFKESILEEVRRDDDPSETVYQLNFQFFPLVEEQNSDARNTKGRESDAPTEQ